MTITPLRAVGLAGLLLAALSVQTSSAAATGPRQADHASTPPAIHVTPYLAANPQAAVATPSPAAGCPCNADLPGGLSAAAQSPTRSNAARSANSARQVGALHPRANQSSRTFDWNDAIVGAAVTAAVGLLVLGAASLLGRRRLRGRLPVS
jgi:hypothetical protein